MKLSMVPLTLSLPVMIAVAAGLARADTVPGAAESPVAEVQRVSLTPATPAQRGLPSRTIPPAVMPVQWMSAQRLEWRLQQLEGELSVLRRVADQHERRVGQLVHAGKSEPARVLERIMAGMGMALVLASGMALAWSARARRQRPDAGNAAARVAQAEASGPAVVSRGVPALLRKHWRAQ